MMITNFILHIKKYNSFISEQDLFINSTNNNPQLLPQQH